MRCWKCGQELTDGTSVCTYCGISQARPDPVTAVGRAMRSLYDRYGAQEVLANGAYLTSGLSDLVDDSKKLRNQLKMAVDAGIGRLYLEQLNYGPPSDDFSRRVKLMLMEDVGLNDKAAAELMGYFDEMIGWRMTSGSSAPGHTDSSGFKYCKRCQAEVPVTANFCTECGGSEFSSKKKNTPTPPTPPQKRKKKGLLIAIALLAVIVIGTIALGGQRGKTHSTTTGNNDSSQNAIAYTKGGVVDGSYINEWANISFPIPDGFPEADSDTYDALASQVGNAELGYVSVNELSGKQFWIGFRDFSKLLRKYTDAEVMDQEIGDLSNDPEFTEQGIEARIDEYYDTVIAGEKYLAGRVTLLYSGEERLFAHIYIRILDDHEIFIVAFSQDEDEINNIISSIISSTTTGNNTTSNEHIDLPENVISYTKGEVVDDVYINEWANMSFPIPDEFPEADLAAYNSLATQAFNDSDNVEVGYISVNELNGKQFMILFQNSGNYLRKYTASENMDAVISGVLSNDSELAELGIELRADEYYDTVIAGETYLTGRVAYLSGGAEAAYIHYYIRTLDDHVIFIVVSSADEEEIEDIISSIAPYR